MTAKDIEEFDAQDLSKCLEHAEQIAMGTIEDRYHEVKDEDVVCIDTIHAVKKAVEVLHMVHEMRHAVK